MSRMLTDFGSIGEEELEMWRRKGGGEMSEEVAAVCERCEQATTGRIYEPYICAACKIEEQEAEIKALHIQLEKVTESKVKYRRWYQEKSDEYSEVLSYKIAFKTLVKELAK